MDNRQVINQASDQVPLDFCLLIPCYNNADGLVRSLRSVVYDPSAFLVLVVDDGSRVPVEERVIRQELGSNVPVKVLRLPANEGITGALNTGLLWITRNVNTRLIARLDCGDLCDEQRFKLQAGLMIADPALVLTGSWCKFRETVSGDEYSYITSVTREGIVKEMHSRNVFIHPTVMFRTSILPESGFYPGDYELAEDYAFFWTLLKLGRVAMIPEFLVTCEINKRGLSISNKGKQLIARWKVVSSFGTAPVLKLRGFLRLISLLILPKELVLWLKKKKA